MNHLAISHSEHCLLTFMACVGSIIHLVLTVVIQFFFLRDLEKMAGASRVAVIYIVSGMAGNLASSIFVPYRAEVSRQRNRTEPFHVLLMVHWLNVSLAIWRSSTPYL